MVQPSGDGLGEASAWSMGRVEVITGEGLNGKFARVCEIAVRAQNVFLEKKMDD